MKTKFSLATVFLFLILSSFDIPNSTSGDNCPADANDPPVIILNPSKVTCCILSNGSPHCYEKSTYFVPIFFQFEYVLQYENGNLLNYEELAFLFNIEDLHGNPLHVYSPSSASGNTFEIRFDYSSLTNIPSGPYGAYIETNAFGKKKLVFNVDYSAALPIAYPTDFTIRSNFNVYVKELRQKGTVSADYWIEHSICSEGADHHIGSRIGDNTIENQLLKAHPNPFNNFVELQVQAPEIEKPQVTVLNLKGQNMNMSSRLKYTGENLWVAAVDTKTLPAGIYIYQVKFNDKLITQKLIKY